MAAHLLPRRLVLDSIRVKSFTLVGVFLFSVPFALNGAGVAVGGLLLLLPLKFLALYEAGSYAKTSPRAGEGDALATLSYDVRASETPLLLSLNPSFLFPMAR